MEALDAAFAKATAGEWQVSGSHVYGTEPQRPVVAQVLSWPAHGQHDTAAIVALHNAYPDLRAYITALEAHIAAFEARLVSDEAVEAATSELCCGYDTCARNAILAAIAAAQSACAGVV